MNVDKARFLLLTTAISAATAVALSASGCTVQEKDKDTGSSGNVPTDSGGGTDSSTDAYTGDSSAEDAGDASDGGACLEDDGIAPVCSDAGTGYTCEDACDRYGVNFKKGIARSIKDCFYKLPTCEGADADRLACVDDAARAACADPTAATFCAPLYCSTSTAPGTLQKDDCEAVVKLLSTAGRTNFTNCITEAGGACDPNAELCITTIQ